MTAFATLTSHQTRLAARPNGLPVREGWSFTSEPVTEPDAGEVLVKPLALSLDPAMRGWMNEGKSYIAPVSIGAVIASKNPAFAAGDATSCGTGVQEYCLVGGDEIEASGRFEIDLRPGAATQWLNVLDMPGMTAYFGLMDVGQPQPGETGVGSGAAGAVGQTVGQPAKIEGCRGVGSAGGPRKCAWVVKELRPEHFSRNAAEAVQRRELRQARVAGRPGLNRAARPAGSRHDA